MFTLTNVSAIELDFTYGVALQKWKGESNSRYGGGVKGHFSQFDSKLQGLVGLFQWEYPFPEVGAGYGVRFSHDPACDLALLGRIGITNQDALGVFSIKKKYGSTSISYKVILNILPLLLEHGVFIGVIL